MSADGEPERAWLVPEVVQTSAMDCGPAALTALFAGFGVHTGYGALRELCQTDVDGTSITTLEELTVALGLDAQQVMLPVDHLLLDGFATLPAIAVVVLANGFTHFVLVWRRHGPLIQVMDPARGRVWVPRARLLADLYRHRLSIAAAEWREWAGTDGFCMPLGLRLAALGLARSDRQRLIAAAQADPGWRRLGALDAATRLTAQWVGAGAVRRGGEAARLVARLVERDADATDGAAPVIPPPFWSVRPDGEETLVFEAALVVSVTGPAAAPRPDAARPSALASVLAAPPARPERRLWAILAADRWLVPVLALAAAVAGAGAMAEIIVLRHLLDAVVTGGLAGGLGILAFLAAGLLGLELALAGGGQVLGRRLELRLRRAFYEKMPRLGDQYFRSRLVSDLAQRAFELRRLRLLPTLVVNASRVFATLLFAAAGIAAVYPPGLPLVAAALLVTIAAALVSQPVLQQHEQRQRTYAGALTRFVYDALIGLVPLRSHDGADALRAEQEDLVVAWARSGRRALTARVAISASALAANTAVTILLVRDYIADGGSVAGVLVLLYFALQLPELGEALFGLARQYPIFRATTARLLEPLDAAEESHAWYSGETDPPGPPDAVARGSGGVGLAFDRVCVIASGRTILDEVSLALAPGEHVAIVGPSGAGKSSLVGLLLGWHRPAAGTVRADGRLVQGATLHALRRVTAWVDPQVQLWNASLDDNLRYGSGVVDPAVLETAIATAALEGVRERLGDPSAALGEGGRLVSGGEGQRVRLARALVRADARLAILDEPFRGLDRGQRRALLARVRAHWRAATFLFISHDVADTLGFDRVLVIEGGRVVEDGVPVALAASASRYRALLDAERSVRSLLWDRPDWQRRRLDDGRLH